MEVLTMLSSSIFVKLEFIIRNAKLPQQLLSVSKLIDMLVRVSASSKKTAGRNKRIQSPFKISESSCEYVTFNPIA